MDSSAHGQEDGILDTAKPVANESSAGSGESSGSTAEATSHSEPDLRPSWKTGKSPIGETLIFQLEQLRDAVRSMIDDKNAEIAALRSKIEG